MPTATFSTNGGGSGRITANGGVWATLRALTTGSAGSGQLLMVCSSGYYLYRVFLPFDTSSLPDDAVITGWRLKLYREDSVNPFNNDNAESIIILPSTEVDPTSIANNDYDNVSFSNVGSLAMASFTNHVYATITGTDLTQINKSGYTKLALSHTRDLNNVAPTGNNNIAFAEYSAGNPPVLEVDYTLPGGSPMLFGGGVTIA